MIRADVAVECVNVQLVATGATSALKPQGNGSWPDPPLVQPDAISVPSGSASGRKLMLSYRERTDVPWVECKFGRNGDSYTLNSAMTVRKLFHSLTRGSYAWLLGGSQLLRYGNCSGFADGADAVRRSGTDGSR
jgi:hypothetical protein